MFIVSAPGLNLKCQTNFMPIKRYLLTFPTFLYVVETNTHVFAFLILTYLEYSQTRL